MLFKIDTSIIDIDELFYIDLETDDDNTLDFYFNDEEPFSVKCNDTKQILDKLMTYEFLFYIKNSKTILNLKQILSIITFTDNKDNYYFRIFTKNSNSLILSLNTKDIFEINQLLERISKIQWKNGNT